MKNKNEQICPRCSASNIKSYGRPFCKEGGTCWYCGLDLEEIYQDDE